MGNDKKIIIEDPRTIYALSMTVILYELYKSDYFSTQNNFIQSLKFTFLFLIVGQIAFLFLRGLLLAEVNSDYEKKLPIFSDFVYTYFFQMSVIIFIVGIFIFGTDNIFNAFGMPKILLNKVLYFLIFLFSIIIGLFIWKKIFIAERTKKEIYFAILGWILTSFVFIFFIL